MQSRDWRAPREQAEAVHPNEQNRIRIAVLAFVAVIAAVIVAVAAA